MKYLSNFIIRRSPDQLDRCDKVDNCLSKFLITTGGDD